LYERYMEKRTKHMIRQKVGYAGVTGKCSVCKRALDDRAVKCTPDHCVAMEMM